MDQDIPYVECNEYILLYTCNDIWFNFGFV